jgi:hypothetical protein
MFEYMAKNWKGWSDELMFQTLENDFKISATSDLLGHVKLNIRIEEESISESWKSVVTINIDSCQLENIAQEMRAFFG